MLFINYSCIFIIVFSVQTSLLHLIELAGVTPGLALILAVYCGIRFKGFSGVGAGFLIGLIQDCLSGGSLGINTLSKSLIAYGCLNLRNKVNLEGIILAGIFLLIASFFDGLVFYLATTLLFNYSPPSGFLFPMLPAFSLYNAIVAPLVFYLLDRNRKWILGNLSRQEYGGL